MSTALRAAVCRKLGLSATATRSEIYHKAIRALAGTRLTSDGRDACEDCGRWTHHGSGTPIRHSSRCDTPNAQPDRAQTSPQNRSEPARNEPSWDKSAGPLNANEADHRDDGEWWVDTNYKRRRPGT